MFDNECCKLYVIQYMPYSKIIIFFNPNFLDGIIFDILVIHDLNIRSKKVVAFTAYKESNYHFLLLRFSYFRSSNLKNMCEDIKIRKLPPVWFIKSLNAFRSGLQWMNQKMFPANVVLYERFQNLWLLPCIKVAAELDIAQLLKEKPRSIEELATLTNTNSGNLFRLMRTLSSQGIFRQQKDLRFTNTAMSESLIDGNGSLRFMILHHLGELNWNALGKLLHSVKTGEDAFYHIHGKRIYDFLLEHPDESELFDKSMTNISELAIEPILSSYNFSHVKTVADIGGGEGLLLSSILYKHKNVSGILFDLADGLRKSPEILKRYGVTNRVKTIPGSFFDTGSPLADVYILKNILHNWSEAECIRILSNISETMPEKGKILIIEMIISEDNEFSYGKLIDIQMMVFMHEGKERTRKEYETILQKSGLVISDIISTIAPFSIIEAVRNKA